MATPDLVPAVTSRIVTIDAVELGEDIPKRGTVTFSLPRDLHVSVDGKIIATGARTVTLADGRGQIRLPTQDPDADPGHGIILVRKSWAPGTYAVRVPAGTSPISLASLPEVDSAPLGDARVWTLTGASLAVRYVPFDQGGGGTASVSNGVIALRIDVPRGAPGGLGSIEQQANGLWRVLDDSLPMTRDQLAQAQGFYLLPGPPTGEKTRNGLPIYWMGEQ